MPANVIVVPLDGSETSERALPHALAFARWFAAELLLVSAWEGVDGDVAEVLPSVASDLEGAAQGRLGEYLQRLAGTIEGVTVQTSVLAGDPSEAVLQLLAEQDARLLVLSTHGRSGISRWMYGSVAAKLIREAPVPTLAIGPAVQGVAPEGRAGARILVPLDGSERAEAALPAAVELANTMHAQLVLAQAYRASACRRATPASSTTSSIRPCATTSKSVARISRPA
jgi:nucleotide-binding universal stress UspA family protein